MPETVIAGRYVLEHMLGRGGMSEVYCAEDRELGRRVALKLLAPDADTARFEREARAVASLAHPNVTQLYDYGEDGGRPFMVLEYVPGGTLEERLADTKGKPLPDDETQLISAGIAAGLAHAHARGVIHRDLKPANVLFDEEGRPKLADFGIARMAAGEGTLTEAGTVLGTAAYISPEQASGEPASAASDVYSFGVMLYRMLTGRLPFESADPMELVMMNRDAPLPPITEFRKDPPGLLESTATAALEKDPADRPHDGAALLAALGAAGGAALTTATTALAGSEATQILPVAAGGATTVSPGAAAAAAAGPPPPRPPGRSRVPLLVAGLLALLLAGGALAYELTNTSPSVNDPGTETLPTISIPTHSTTSTTESTASTTTPTTTESTTTAPTTTQQTTTQRTTTQRTTTAPTTTQQTTTAPPPPPTTDLTTTDATTTAPQQSPPGTTTAP